MIEVLRATEELVSVLKVTGDSDAASPCAALDTFSSSGKERI